MTERFDSETERLVYNQFLGAFSNYPNSGLILKPLDKWETALLRREFDLVIYKGSNPLAVVEVKGSFTNKNILARATDQVRSALTITSARFGIATDSITFYFYDRENFEADFVAMSFDDIVLRLVDVKHINITERDKEKVAEIISEVIQRQMSERNELNDLLDNRSLISNIDFDQNSNSFYFLSKDAGINSFENQFFMRMFGQFTEKTICRYTTMNTIFSMLNYLSFRMNGLVGMNDKSEVNYVESYLAGNEKPLSKQHHSSITAINNRYITSCTTIANKDNLTLWRLYADDSRGVCLVFNTVDTNLNSHVLLQKVKYADKDGKHTELELLKEIRRQVVELTGFPFEFKNLGYWKHFFKPYEYSIEDEVRLLIIDDPSIPSIKKDWVLTYTHSIVNPIIDFQLNGSRFPLHLKEVLLGPKCPEQETNKVQLEELVRRKRNEITSKNIDADLKDLKVEMSGIKHYR
ncbi:MAG: hypothetical protein DI539_16275 [Flavobacterium psychrophilum]|nr:MAG: hypothetical protein DI539_16275 [Flavobacterium psychrophilum]